MNSTWTYPYKMLRFMLWLVKSRGYTEWEGEEGPYKEFWGRKKMLLFRPRFDGFVKQLPCGCSKRFGKFVYYRWRCAAGHCNFGKDFDKEEE